MSLPGDLIDKPLANVGDTPSVEHLIRSLNVTLQKTNERLEAMDENQTRLAEAIQSLSLALAVSPAEQRTGQQDHGVLTAEAEPALELLFDNLYEAARRWDSQLSDMNTNLDALIAELREPLVVPTAKEQ